MVEMPHTFTMVTIENAKVDKLNNWTIDGQDAPHLQTVETDEGGDTLRCHRQWDHIKTSKVTSLKEYATKKSLWKKNFPHLWDRARQAKGPVQSSVRVEKHFELAPGVLQPPCSSLYMQLEENQFKHAGFFGQIDKLFQRQFLLEKI